MNKNNTFKQWAYNKLETGLALIFLKGIRKLKKNLDYDDNNILTLKGIEKLESYLSPENGQQYIIEIKVYEFLKHTINK